METLGAEIQVFCRWVVEATIQGSVVIGFILLAKAALRERLAVRWHYYLWVVLLVRLVLPVSIRSRVSIFNLLELAFASERLAGMFRSSAYLRVTALLPFVWVGGVAVVGGVVVWRSFRLWRTVKRERPVTDSAMLDLLEDCKMQMGVQTIVGVIVTNRVKSPVLFGYVRPRVLLPEGLVEHLGLDELQYVFMHELAHLRRRDVYFGWLIALLQVLHWPNPLVWYAFRRMRVDRELACDSLVVSTMGADESPRYGRTIVNLFERFSQVSYVPSITGILEDGSQLERRIKVIAEGRRHSRMQGVGAMLLVAVLGLFTLTNAYSGGKAAGPVIEWERWFGGSEDDKAYSVQQTSDGGYIIAGYTYSSEAGSSDVYLVKTDSEGNMEWEKTFGGKGSDIGYSVRQTKDGGYIVGGFTSSYGAGGDDAYLIKTDAAGNMQWEQVYGGSKQDQYYSVRQTLDGGYVLVGATFSFGAGHRDGHLIKTDSDGNVQWDKTFGGGNHDATGWVEQTTDGGYIVAGYTNSYGVGDLDAYLIKTDPNGDQEWQQTFGGPNRDQAYSVRPTADGGYVLGGISHSYGAGDRDIYLIKTDSNGNLEWNQTFGEDGEEMGWIVSQTIDGGYIIGGATDAPDVFSSVGDAYLIKTDSRGNAQWEKRIGGSKSFGHVGPVEQTSDGGYIAVGISKPRSFGPNWDAYVVKLGPD